ncbi:MAG: hypothetical protein V2I33_23155 [Kangiellaceae bacterium]|jgi:hypothetical protein|nr:hypothetical protein [Kangiellaceae bacterium]
MHFIQKRLICAYIFLFLCSAAFISAIVYAGVLQANNELEELPKVISLSSHRRDLIMLSVHWLREFNLDVQSNSPLSYVALNPTFRVYSDPETEIVKTINNLSYAETLLIQSPIKISERQFDFAFQNA